MNESTAVLAADVVVDHNQDSVTASIERLVDMGVSARDRGMQMQQADMWFGSALNESAKHGLWEHAAKAFCQLSTVAFYRYCQSGGCNYLEIMLCYATCSLDLVKRHRLTGQVKVLALNCLARYWQATGNFINARHFYQKAIKDSDGKVSLELDACLGLVLVYYDQPIRCRSGRQYIDGLEMIDKALRSAIAQLDEESNSYWAPIICSIRCCQAEARAKASNIGRHVDNHELSVIALHQAKLYADKLQGKDFDRPHYGHLFQVTMRRTAPLLGLSIEQLEEDLNL